MSETKRKMCAYGTKCYRKNPEHLSQFYHPSDNQSDNTKLAQKTENRSVKNPIVIEDEEKVSVDTAVYSGSKDTKYKELYENLFVMKFNEELVEFHDFLKSIDLKNPSNTLNSFGLELGSIFNVLFQTFDYSKTDTNQFILLDRFFYDPPEFQTILLNEKTSFHIGYLRDDPNELPCLVCANDGNSCKLQILGDNIFGALHYHFSKTLKSADDQQEKFLNRLKSYAQKHDYSLEPSRSQKIMLRKKKINAPTFHGAGIVVPVVDDVGYRSIGEAPATLQKWLKTIDETEEGSVREEKLEKIHELINYVQFANDECDYGMGLELGLDLFCSGSKHVEKQAKQLLTVAYDLLGRQQFAKVAAAHLEKRSHQPLRLDDLSE